MQRWRILSLSSFPQPQWPLLRPNIFKANLVSEYHSTSSCNTDGSSREDGDDAPGKISRSTQRRRRSSPSSALTKTLSSHNPAIALPQTPRNKIDLSYHNSRLNPRNRSNRPIRSVQALHKEHKSRPALQTVLKKWIEAASILGTLNEPNHNHIQASPSQACACLSVHDLTVLHTRGYTTDDLQIWQSILCNEDDTAATDLLLSSLDHTDTKTRPIPIFVPLMLLKRQGVSPEAVRSLLVYLSWLLRRSEIRQQTSTKQLGGKVHTSTEIEQFKSMGPQGIDKSSLFIFIVRMLRHARNSLPTAIVTIARMYIEAFGGRSRSWRLVRSTRDHSTFMHNRLLRLLSIPPPSSPFMYAPFQQQAQFDILGWMATHKPPLPINREGYRAIVAVLSAQKKTEQERDWANLKVKTWPPWKENKLGLDEEKDPEYGYSRALRAMILSFEAGYGSTWWNEVVRVLSGWDVDWSPTIQTRALLFRHDIWPADSHRESQRRKTLWVARIRATRTVQEAWACFLAYEKERKPFHQAVYLAMFEKLAARTDQRTQPPDSKEVLPPPSSPKEQTYVSRDPPSIDQLALQMHERGVNPSGACLNFLLSHADGLEHGIKYMEWASQHDQGAKALLFLRPDLDERLKDVDLSTFTAFVQLLCRFPVAENSTQGADSSSGKMGLSARRLLLALHETQPIFFCYRLLKARKPRYLPPWISLMASFAYRRSTINVWGGRQNNWINALHGWFFTLRIQDQMLAIGLPPSDLTLRILCRSAEHAIFAALRIKETWAYKEQASPQLKDSVESVLNHSSGRLRRTFQDLMGQEDFPFQKYVSYPSEWSVPKALATAHPEILHSLVRVVGLLRDWQGLIETVSWMQRHEREVFSALQLSNRGHVVLNRTVVAVRVFSERSWLVKEDQSLPATAAPSDVVQELTGLLESNPKWGGWPSDKQVDEYCQAQEKVLGRCPL